MGSQRTFASMAWNAKGKVTRREQFLAEMEVAIPWARLLRLIEPYYPKAGSSPGLRGFSSTFSEIGPTPRARRDLKDSG
jgi:hypothetical protein